jgi:hypothetical protein
MFWNVVRRYAVMAVAVPLAAAGARKLSKAVEARRGPSRATVLLRRGADAITGNRRRSGLFGRRRARRFGWR